MTMNTLMRNSSERTPMFWPRLNRLGLFDQRFPLSICPGPIGHLAISQSGNFCCDLFTRSALAANASSRLCSHPIHSSARTASTVKIPKPYEIARYMVIRRVELQTVPGRTRGNVYFIPRRAMLSASTNFCHRSGLNLELL